MPNFEWYDEINEILKKDIKTHSAMNGEAMLKFVLSQINEFKDSTFYKNAIVSEKYFANEADIMCKTRQMINKDGLREDTTLLSNTKSQHNFLYKIIKQKNSFLLSKPFSFNSNIDMSVEENKEYMEGVSKYFDKRMRNFLRSLLKSGQIDGIGWCQRYYDTEGNIRYKKIPSLEVIPLWANYEHTELDGVIRFYDQEHYTATGEKKTIHKVEFYDKSGVYYLENKSNSLVADYDVYGENELVAMPNYYRQVVKVDEFGQPILDNDGNYVYVLQGEVFDKIPFVPVKANEDETPVLMQIKTLIDEYNAICSQCGDQLKDVLNDILKVKGYSGSDAEEFVYNLNTIRTIFLDGDGDVDTLHTDIDISAMEKYLDRVKQDIYDLSMSVNTEAEKLQAASGIALQMRYSDLILDCSDTGNEVESAILTMFDDYNFDRKQKGEYVPENIDLEVVFNMDMPIDEQSVIANVVASAGVISKKTAIANHPWVKNVEDELNQLEQEENEKDTYNELFGQQVTSVDEEE